MTKTRAARKVAARERQYADGISMLAARDRAMAASARARDLKARARSAQAEADDAQAEADDAWASLVRLLLSRVSALSVAAARADEAAEEERWDED